MNPENIRLTFCRVEVMWPQLRRFQAGELPALYSSVFERHPFERFELHDEWAGFDAEAQGSLQVHRDHMEYEEYVSTDFSLVKRNVVDILDLIDEHFPLTGYFGPRVILRANWEAPTEVGQLSDYFRENLFTIKTDQYELLKDEITDFALSLRGHSEQPHYGWQLRLNPYPRDELQLAVQVEYRFYSPFDSKEVAGERMQQVNDFLRGEVTRFVCSFMP